MLAAVLALAAGCARYEPKPLLAPEFQRVLAERAPDAPGLLAGIADARYEPADGLTLDEAELLCLYLNPSLRAARERAKIPVAAARYAGLWDDPEIGFDALRILDDVEEASIFGSSLSFTIPISGRLSVARDLAQVESRVAMMEAWSEELAVLLTLRETWADWSTAIRSLEVSRELHERLRDLVELTDRREELGELIAAEAVAFRLAAAGLGLDVERLEAEEAGTRIALLALLGLLPDARVELLPLGLSDQAIVDEPRDAVYERSPEVLLAAARYESAEESLRLEIRKQYPDLSLGPLFENEEGMNRLGIGLSIPLPILNANRQGIAEAEASRGAARADWERAVQENLAKLAQAQVARRAAKRRIESLRTKVVPAADRQIAEARRLAELGEIDTLLILEALQAEREAALDLIEAEADAARRQARVDALAPASVPNFGLSDEEAAQP